jgi:hypothetical protein
MCLVAAALPDEYLPQTDAQAQQAGRLPPEAIMCDTRPNVSISGHSARIDVGEVITSSLDYASALPQLGLPAKALEWVVSVLQPGISVERVGRLYVRQSVAAGRHLVVDEGLRVAAEEQYGMALTLVPS